VKAIVVGAGISGLAAAFRLHQAGHTVDVFEASDHVGGRMSTVQHNGHRIDVGAAVVSSKYKAVLQLARDIGVADQLMKTSGVMGIIRDGAIHRLDSSAPTGALRTKLLSGHAKFAAGKLVLDAWRMRAKLEPELELHPASKYHCETAQDYSLRRLSPELLRYLVDPMVRTVHLRETDEIAAAGLFSIMVGFLGDSLLNTSTGMDWLCRALADRVNVSLNTAVVSVEETGDGVRVAAVGATHAGTTNADICVIALAAPQMAAIHTGLDATERDLISSLQYGNLMSIAIGLSAPLREHAAMIAVPRPENENLCAVMVDERRAPGRVPPGKGMLGTHWAPSFVEKYWKEPDSVIGEAAIAEIATVFPGVDSTVEWIRVHRFEPGVLVTGPGTHDTLRRFHRSYRAGSRVQVSGDYFGGVTFSSALSSGERAALRCIQSQGGGRRSFDSDGRPAQ
jgi:oxygen-dependent protoporphyrinogen oxidase